jgi:hypothetical protein
MAVHAAGVMLVALERARRTLGAGVKRARGGFAQEGYLV